MPREKIATVRGRADRAAQKWFWKDAVCVAAPWPEWEAWGSPPCWCRFGHPEWAHVRKRKDRGVMHHPKNAVTLCSAHHDLLDRMGLMEKFIEWLDGSRERLDLIDGLIRERHLAGYPDLRPVYEHWTSWYKGRDDCFATWDGVI